MCLTFEGVYIVYKGSTVYHSWVYLYCILRSICFWQLRVSILYTKEHLFLTVKGFYIVYWGSPVSDRWGCCLLYTKDHMCLTVGCDYIVYTKEHLCLTVESVYTVRKKYCVTRKELLAAVHFVKQSILSIRSPIHSAYSTQLAKVAYEFLKIPRVYWQDWLMYCQHMTLLLNSCLTLYTVLVVHLVNNVTLTMLIHVSALQDGGRGVLVDTFKMPPKLRQEPWHN